MGLRFHRSIKLLPGLRLNFGKRGISASIGVRGAHVTYGPTGTRTTVGIPGSGLSYTHVEKSHPAPPIPTLATPPGDSPSTPGSAGRGFLWLGLLMVIVIVVTNRVTTHLSHPQATTPPQPATQTATQVAVQTADNERTAAAKRAAVGLTQIRHTIANSNTLQLSRATAMPTGAICYQLHLTNSYGVAYVRTAVIDGTVRSISGSDGFTALWNRRCALPSSGRDITLDVAKVIHPPAN